MQQSGGFLRRLIRRDESAIQETDARYGHYCHAIALNIVSVKEDAEECVSDTYLNAWNSIPPQKPDSLKTWLGKTVRNISLDLWRKIIDKKDTPGWSRCLMS